jgi:hypothetical protein
MMTFYRGTNAGRAQEVIGGEGEDHDHGGAHFCTISFGRVVHSM